MKTENLDVILNNIRDAEPSPELLAAAYRRTQSKLAAMQSAGAALSGCADFQVLIPAYRDQTLSAEKRLLLTDHTSTCLDCRHAMQPRQLRRPQPISTQFPVYAKWAVAALVFLSFAGVISMIARQLIVPSGARASIESVSGTLYRIADTSSTPVFAGGRLEERQLVRTAKGSTAMLRLTDGSLVEMNERSQLSVTRAVRGTTIRLDRGNVIVHAAKQREGALFVHTADSEVMVKGTIFAVTSGTKGSRVSVVEGSVKVDHGGGSQMLKPGDQVSTDPSVAAIPVQNDIAWSRNATEYLAMLGELSGLQKQIEALPGPALRTTSKLLDLVPENTVVYAAIPNIGGTLAEANQLFLQKMESSPALKQWWDRQGHSQTDLQTMIQKVQTISSYLGDEIVLAFTSDDEGKTGAPIVIAEAKRSGLQEALQAEKSVAGGFGITKGVVALTSRPEALKQFQDRLNAGSPSGFANSAFHQRIAQAYSGGASWLFCANLSAITPNRRQLGPLNGVRYLVMERKEVSGEIRNQATLAFDGNRRGLAAWLAAPAPMSSLDFVSPDASMAFSVVFQNPGAMLTNLLQESEAKNPDLKTALDNFQQQTGVNVLSDLAAPLGGEATFAFDGPLLPVPSWKLAVEVYSPDRLQWAIQHLVDAYNQKTTANPKLILTASQEGTRTYYSIKPADPSSPFELDYAFIDSYLVAAANRTLLNSAIQNRATGYTLPRSEKFRAQLPKDANPNFSALVYHDVGGVVGTLADGLKTMNAPTAQQKAAIDALKANATPGLIYAYGAPDQITVAARGGFFGFNLDSLALPSLFQFSAKPKPPVSQ